MVGRNSLETWDYNEEYASPISQRLCERADVENIQLHNRSRKDKSDISPVLPGIYRTYKNG
jgi:hypothetical protein